MTAHNRDDQVIITKLITCEKLLKQIHQGMVSTSASGIDYDFQLLRFYNVFLLTQVYKDSGDIARIIRFVEANTSSNINFKDSLTILCKKHKLRKELSNYILQIQSRYGEALISSGKFQKACHTMEEIVRLYDRWRHNQYSITPDIESHSKNEFGVDDFITVRASEAECLFQVGNLFQAIDTFEKVKKEIQEQVVFDKPLLYINICNQLGNCYLKLNEMDFALDNFEQSYFLIMKHGSEGQEAIKVDELIVAKICSNIGMISGNKGFLNDSVKMHERALQYKMKVFPQFHSEIMNSQIQIAQAYSQLTEYDRSVQFYSRAYETSKNVNGEFDLKTAQVLTLQANAQLKANKFSDSIKTYEHAGVVLSRVESSRSSLEQQQEVRINLSKLYLQLVHLYMLVNKTSEAQSIVKILESRIEKSGENAFKLYNELANVLRKHNNLDLAIDLYKKAILAIKQLHKTNYLQVKETGKILINVATCEQLRENHGEALKYFEHTLQVLQNTSSFVTRDASSFQEQAKINIQMGNINRDSGNLKQATQHYNKAIQTLEMIDQTKENGQEVEGLLLEAKYQSRHLSEILNK